MAQSNKILVGTMIESLVIEFDQEKYEEFHSSGSLSLWSLWKYYKISANFASNKTPKIIVQDNLPKDYKNLTGLKKSENSFNKAQGSGFVSQ